MTIPRFVFFFYSTRTSIGKLAMKALMRLLSKMQMLQEAFNLLDR